MSLKDFSKLSGVLPAKLMDMELCLVLEVLGGDLSIKREEFCQYRRRLACAQL